MKPGARQGDDGLTYLFGSPERVAKDSSRLSGYGTVDELNCAIGLARAACADGRLGPMLLRIQSDLFRIGSDLATPTDSPARAKVPAITAEDVTQLETWIDGLRAELPEITHFILPGGGEGAARLHLARAVCRRTERALVGLARTEQINSHIVPFVNRLSDLLFESARWANRQAKVDEIQWEGKSLPKSPRGPSER